MMLDGPFLFHNRAHAIEDFRVGSPVVDERVIYAGLIDTLKREKRLGAFHDERNL